MKSIKQLAVLSIGALLLAGCAKEKEYEKVEVDGLKSDGLVEQRVAKTQIQQLCSSSDPLLFVPSVGEVPRAVSSARPYELGDAKIVTCEIKQDKIVFKEVEDDTRFAVNANNKSPVFEIEIEHIDFKCAEDEYGDCTNKEEEDKEKPWQQRRQVNIDVQSTEILAKDANLSLDLYNLLEGCFSEDSSEVTKFKSDSRSLNFTIKRQMSASLECADSFIQGREDIRYSKFYVDYNFSLVKLSDIADPNYKAVNYPKYDQEKFGFFKTEKVNMTTDNLTHVIGTKSYLMNRWSPNKEKITYYLSKHFYDKGMESVLQATIDGIDTVNLSLRKAGATIQIELKNGRGVSEGDIKNNFLVLVKDPHASGVIGYGPAIKNPNTGEILSARTIMYYGTIRKTIARAYDRLLEDNPVVPVVDVTPADVTPTDDGEVNPTDALTSEAHVLDQVNGTQVEQEAMVMYRIFTNTVSELNPTEYFNREDIQEVNFDQSMSNVKTELEELKEELKGLSEKTFYHESMTNATPVISSLGIKARKPWAELTEEERSKIIDQMLPYLWVPTLVHEFGHNLGLRHNFLGSADKANFYSKKEAAAMKLKRIPEYSSIMDYAYNSHTELSVMGKYDIAALRFAYAREVEHGTGKMIKVEDSLEKENKLYVKKNISDINEKAKEFAEENSIEGSDYESVKKAIDQLVNNAADEDTALAAETLKKEFNKFATMQLRPYEYCTDENVSTSVQCNRHDEGVGLKGLAEHLVAKYHEYYKYRNLRGRSYNFNSVRGDFSYALYVLGSFANMRQVLTAYSAYENAGWATSKKEEQKEKYQDAKAASDTIFKFFVDVVKKAPKSCAVYELNEVEPSKSALKGILPLTASFNLANACKVYQEHFRGPRSSFPVGVKENIVAIDAGNFINNATEYEKTFEVSPLISQIDIRGIALDKVFAINMLTARDSSIQTGFSSFMDFPKYREEVVKLINEVISNKLATTVSFVAPDGKIVTQEHEYNIIDTHTLTMSYNPIINGFLGLRYEENDIRKVMLRFVKQNLSQSKSEVDFDENMILLDDLKVHPLKRRVDNSDKNYDEVIEFTTNGVVTMKFGVYDFNRIGMQLAKTKKTLDKLEALDEKQKELLMAVFRGVVKPQDVKDEAIIAIIANQEAIAPTIDYLQGYLTEDTLKKTFKALAQ
jgi:hypothetical protein